MAVLDHDGGDAWYTFPRSSGRTKNSMMMEELINGCVLAGGRHPAQQLLLVTRVRDDDLFVQSRDVRLNRETGRAACIVFNA